MFLEIVFLLAALVVALGFLLRAAWTRIGKAKAEAKQKDATIGAFNERNKTAREVRRESDEKLIDRLSPPK